MALQKKRDLPCAVQSSKLANGRSLNQEIIKCDFQNANICTADVGSEFKDRKSALCRRFDGKLHCKNDVHKEVTHLLLGNLNKFM